MNQTSGLLDEEITITKDTMADEIEEQDIDENIPATQNDVKNLTSIVLEGEILVYGGCRPTKPFPEFEKDDVLFLSLNITI
ncbi:hypothetical protein LOD99_11094 [Oopsacas minuta]|uniref:Uncharacterized protein n=1 Tax=Oopsacas minuta TaxID=111878 RepID=A0AAV7KB10_9METZ|nr:hypothetical protein LOD99_11094 [Oopsacas minuta]